MSIIGLLPFSLRVGGPVAWGWSPLLGLVANCLLFMLVGWAMGGVLPPTCEGDYEQTSTLDAIPYLKHSDFFY